MMEFSFSNLGSVHLTCHLQACPHFSRGVGFNRVLKKYFSAPARQPWDGMGKSPFFGLFHHPVKAISRYRRPSDLIGG
jgi:hypothetical protein